ncbi:hypothetical protein EH31_01105 [Erythrobacter longus]|uniref:Uncharacterized protein n=1 Tax=Erythrobacter longus TaxID=1044 RepID=A0A074MEV1_ERYLO|nr:hypothetical protein [Erythrobacter longus]KEO91290.1 hypothetical protein EH31_01105 [Erythrobacter longus]
MSISHDPLDEASLDLVTPDGGGADQLGEILASVRQKRVWVEFVRDGLTFDLTGLAPGLTADFPQVFHRFDLKQLPEQADYEVLHLTPGHHLAGGERLIPIAQGLLGLARDLVDHFDELDCVVWPPSASAIGHQFFESVVTAWLEGGPFPALGLTAFRETVDGALQSEGLDYWIGQEVRIEPPLSADKVTATRLGVRLINQLVLVGGIEQSERVVAPDGTNLVMRTSRNGKFVRVWRE